MAAKGEPVMTSLAPASPRLNRRSVIALATAATLSAHATTSLADIAPTITQLAGGTLSRYAHFPSRHVAPRTIAVWTPRDYAPAQHHYGALYMHDGQNLFSPDEAFGGQTWEIAQHVQALIDAGRIPPTLIVGVWNSGASRGREYAPLLGQSQEDIARLATDWGGPSLSAAYLTFLIDELKPFIDGHYSTAPDPNNTFIMGSSMGGLASLNAYLARPDIFGGAGCVSTHWPIRGPAALSDDAARADADRIGRAFIAAAAALPPPGRLKVYFDHGDQTLDALYAPYQAAMDQALLARGAQAGKDFLSLAFPGADHSEKSWRARVDKPLIYLLGAR